MTVYCTDLALYETFNAAYRNSFHGDELTSDNLRGQPAADGLICSAIYHAQRQDA